MCLGVPGKILSVESNPLGLSMGCVDFGGVQRTVSLAFTPEAGPGDWVIIHAGYAISQLDEQEARETLALLAEIEQAGAELGARSEEG